MKVVRRDVSGVLLLDKPVGMTSNQALQRVKHLFNAQKAGHTGSLDPIASGLLPICLGQATKLSSFFLGSRKTYWTRIRLGISTATGDIEGDVTRQCPVSEDVAAIKSALERFLGEIEQVPPMYSALKRNGQPLYKLARKGIEVEREPRKVTVHGLRLLDLQGDTLDLWIDCSSGFYIRSLAMDLGDALGCGAHVVELRRLQVASLGIDSAHGIEYLEQLDSVAQRDACLLAGDRSLPEIPEVQLSDDATYYLCRGQAVKAVNAPDSGWVRLYNDDAGFLGLGAVLDDGRIAPKRLFHHPGR